VLFFPRRLAIGGSVLSGRSRSFFLAPGPAPLHLFRHERCAAFGADLDRFEVLAAETMGIQQRVPLSVDHVDIAPVHNRHDNRVKASPFLRQTILVAQRPLLVRHPDEREPVDEFLQPVGEDRSGDAKALLEICKPAHPHETDRKISNVQRSPLTDTVRAIEQLSSLSSLHRMRFFQHRVFSPCEMMQRGWFDIQTVEVQAAPVRCAALRQVPTDQPGKVILTPRLASDRAASPVLIISRAISQPLMQSQNALMPRRSVGSPTTSIRLNLTPSWLSHLHHRAGKTALGEDRDAFDESRDMMRDDFALNVLSYPIRHCFVLLSAMVGVVVHAE
jgi:hypothetical protein